MICLQPVAHTIRQGDNLYQLSLYYLTTVQSILSQNPDIDPYNLRIGTTITICPGKDYTIKQSNSNSSDYLKPPMIFSLICNMRKAWEQHVYWTRMLLISIAERLKDQDAVTARLLQNPKDIANIFANFYNADTAYAIEQLLTEHLQIGADLITALRDGKTAKAENLKRKWYANADKMADAFSGINPYYNRDEVRKMLYTHLDLTTKEVAMRLAGNYPEDIKAFDEVEQEALSMADYFSSGIIRQFPQKFHLEK